LAVSETATPILIITIQDVPRLQNLGELSVFASWIFKKFILSRFIRQKIPFDT